MDAGFGSNSFNFCTKLLTEANIGSLRINQGTWFNDYPRTVRTPTAVVGSAAFRRFARRFMRTWPASTTDDADDHLGRRYALLELR